MPRVLIIDDHPLIQEGQKSILESAGMQVVAIAGDVEGGVQAFRRTVPDVVLLDLHLDGRSGFDVIRELQHRGHAPRVVVCTMQSDEHRVVEAIRLGVLGYVLKDAPGAAVVEAVRAAARGERCFPPELLFSASESMLRQGNDKLLDTLSTRERQVLELVVAGHSSAQIGAMLHLSPKTVDTYRSRLMAKLGVGDLASLVRLAIREGLSLPD